MILVTGASGLLGASMVLCARQQKREVVGLFHKHALRLPGAAMLGVDLTNQEETQALVARLNPASIIHCAAATNVDWCEDHPSEADRINTQASSSLAQIAQNLGSTFVYVSTDAVFDGKKGTYSEMDEPAPINVYGRSKLNGEEEVRRWHPSALVVRVNIYGWNAQNKLSLAEWILRGLDGGQQVLGFTDIHFSPMLVNDLAEVLLAMLDSGLTGVYHVVGSERISKYEFAKRVAALFGFDPLQVVPANSTEVGLRAARPADISLDTAKVAAALARSMPDVASGLARFHRLHKSGYPQKLKTYAGGAGE